MDLDSLNLKRTEKLLQTIRHAYENSPAFQERMKACGLAPEDIREIGDLEKIPVLKKQDLVDLQAEDRPFGGLLGVKPAELARIYQSPGPIYDPQGREEDFWRFSEPLEVAGFGPGDIVMNTFSYHLSPAGFMLDDGIRRAGATVVPAGVGNTELQVGIIHDLKATGFVGTPSFLITLLGKSRELGLDFTISKAYVTAEPFTSDQRSACDAAKIDVYQGYGTADAGSIAFECSRKSSMHVSTDFVLQIADPNTGSGVPDGEVGEVVVTSFDKTYPLIRFGTGDLSSIIQESCGCGLASERMAGFMGRTGDGFKIRGMFVYVRQIAEVVEAFQDLGEFGVEIDREGDRDVLALTVENKRHDAADEIRDAFETKVRDVLRVRADRVEFVEEGALSEVDKVVDRRRWY